LNLRDWLPEKAALTFAQPWFLLLLIAIPLLAWFRGQSGPAAALTFSSTAALRSLGKTSAARAGKFLRALLLVSLALFAIAMARPQLGKSLTQVEASGIDIILALDVSGSMLTKDFTIGGEQATRIDAIREVTRKFIEGRPNDRIGIIAFAGRPYMVSPMTLDHDWLLKNLDRLKIGLVEDGTAIGSGMAAAANRLNDKRSKSHVIVLLTDGENNTGKIPPNTAAEAIKALKIHFYAIGAGINGIALTKLDVLDGLESINLCVGYRLDGKELDHLPAIAGDQARVEPIYETMEGWQDSTRGARTWNDLPAQAVKYVRHVEELIGAPVALLSTSPERDDTILVHDPFQG